LEFDAPVAEKFRACSHLLRSPRCYDDRAPSSRGTPKDLAGIPSRVGSALRTIVVALEKSGPQCEPYKLIQTKRGLQIDAIGSRKEAEGQRDGGKRLFGYWLGVDDPFDSFLQQRNIEVDEEAERLLEDAHICTDLESM